jgi:rubrerythrin
MRMTALKHEPWEFASLDELLDLAAAMEQEAIDGYAALSERMSALGHPDLAVVFDALVREETGHLGKVREWRAASGSRSPTRQAAAPKELFDDEGAAFVAPELMTAYRTFSMAVRNEERAFMFWTYVSANAQSKEIRQAAERMAHEELGHVATLRRERRKAFHMERDKGSDTDTDLPGLEERLSHLLDALTQEANGTGAAETLRGHAQTALGRMNAIRDRFFDRKVMRRMRSDLAAGKALPLCEHLLDCYLDLGDTSTTERDADRARRFAAQMIACIRTVRGVDR